jgi:hypothetical protein
MSVCVTLLRTLSREGYRVVQLGALPIAAGTSESVLMELRPGPGLQTEESSVTRQPCLPDICQNDPLSSDLDN